jgi:hypothetical protein
LFPEAICIQERRLRPLKKGLARIVFQTEESFDFKKDVLIVPVGLNYSNAKQFRSKVFINVGEPISVTQYESQFKVDKVKTINEFTKALEAKMTDLLVVIKDPLNDALVSSVEEIYSEKIIKEINGNPDSLADLHLVSMKIANTVNSFADAESGNCAALREKVAYYQRRIKVNDLRDHLLRPERVENMSFGGFFMEALFIYLGSPFYWIGLLLNYPPYILAKKASDGKVKNVEFYASFCSNLAMFIWIFYYGMQLLAVALAFRSWPFLGLYALFVPLSLFFVLRFYSFRKKIFGRWKLLRMVRKERDTIVKFVEERKEIIQDLDRIFSTYGK